MKLKMSDLDQNGKPILEECGKCHKQFPRSVITNHNKMCGVKKGTRLSYTRYHPTKITESAPRISLNKDHSSMSPSKMSYVYFKMTGVIP